MQNDQDMRRSKALAAYTTAMSKMTGKKAAPAKKKKKAKGKKSGGLKASYFAKC